MLAAVAFSAERLLLAPDWGDAIDDVLRHLGLAGGGVPGLPDPSSEPDGDGDYLATQLAEWCAPDVSSQFGNPALNGAGDARQRLRPMDRADDEPGDGPRHRPRLPGGGASELIREQIGRSPSFPVFVDGDWWAFIGFDDCFVERRWSRHELDSLRAVGGHARSGRPTTARRGPPARGGGPVPAARRRRTPP